MKKKPIKIALVDDHSMFRAGIISIFDANEGIEVLFDSAHGQEFLHQLESRQPDMILVDLKMPQMSGQHLIQLVRERNPDMKVIVLSMYDDESVIINCLKELRVNSYLLKSAPPIELIQAIHRVYEDGYHFTPHISEIMFHGLRKRNVTLHQNEARINISNREKEVLELICAGDTNSEIAEKLYISKRTVEGHRKNLLEKTHCRNTASLVAFSFQQKMISI